MWIFHIALLLAATFSLSAHGSSEENFALPKSKVYLSICYKAALELHPGQIEQLSFYRSSEKSYFDFVVRSTDGKRWTILCDSTNGKVVNVQLQNQE